MKVTIIRASRRYVHANEKPPKREQIVVEFADRDLRCNIDTQTRVLRIITGGGTPVFAIDQVDYFFTDAVEVKRTLRA